MRVLFIHKFFRLTGGVERYMFSAFRELEQHGHEVIPFSMADDRNVPSRYSKYFVSNIEYQNTSRFYKLAHAPRIVGKSIYSFETRRKLEALIRDTKPDIAHVQMVFHQLSPSVFHSLHKYGLPTVMRVPNFKLVCPAVDLYISHKSELCERCLTGRYFNCTLHRCIKGSFLASSLASAAMYFHKWTQIYERNVDLFMTATNFLRDKIVEGGIPAEKIRMFKPTLDISQFEPDYEPGDYFVCYGRLVRQKGVHTLIQAARKVPQYRVLILGDGEERENLEQLARSVGAKNVEFLGFKTGRELTDLLRKSLCIVVPSEWYETFGFVIYEAYAMGKPVIGASIGAIPEAIEVGETGFLFEPGNADELAEKMTHMYENKSMAPGMGRRGRAKVEQLCTGHYDRLMAVYEEAMSKP